ncbi:uncharacterized protein LOC127833559 [Dreissena polymorpha]|uniref:uncharacterized protein LOC127833559 n=1 Tax=Dreissena polymorpha TaxID=45954 RepID=UPI002265479D|nr:uncharacterized protein LOC127833559 [Dreissena polymorpha]
MFNLTTSGNMTSGFNDAEANSLIEKLKNRIREENMRYALGMISCYDPATPNNYTRITIEEGLNFIKLLRYNFNFGTVYVKAGLDYEILVSNKNQQNEKTISLACISVNGKVVVESKMVINDINDNTQCGLETPTLQALTSFSLVHC